VGTGRKIVFGCGCLVLLGAAAALGVLGMGAWWAKGRLQEMAGGLGSISKTADEIDAWTKKANANPYVPRPDGVVTEPRLVKFLETRRRVYAVYERYQQDIRELQKKAETPADKLKARDIWSAGGKLAEVFGAIRLAQMKGLAEVGMSEAEYRDIQLAVYKSAWASDTERRSGKLPAEAVSQSMTTAAAEVEKAMRSGVRAAQKENVPGAGQLSPEDAKRVRDTISELGDDAGEALAVPRANVELFRKHEAEIRKYAMNGLAYIGL
jgi:hypothetical protein